MPSVKRSVEVQVEVGKGKKTRVRRRMGDAEMTRSGGGVFIGDMRREAGVEVEVLDEDDPKTTFEG